MYWNSEWDHPLPPYKTIWEERQLGFPRLFLSSHALRAHAIEMRTTWVGEQRRSGYMVVGGRGNPSIWGARITKAGYDQEWLPFAEGFLLDAWLKPDGLGGRQTILFVDCDNGPLWIGLHNGYPRIEYGSDYVQSEVQWSYDDESLRPIRARVVFEWLDGYVTIFLGDTPTGEGELAPRDPGNWSQPLVWASAMNEDPDTDEPFLGEWDYLRLWGYGMTNADIAEWGLDYARPDRRYTNLFGKLVLHWYCHGRMHWVFDNVDWDYVEQETGERRWDAPCYLLPPSEGFLDLWAGRWHGTFGVLLSESGDLVVDRYSHREWDPDHWSTSGALEFVGYADTIRFVERMRTDWYEPQPHYESRPAIVRRVSYRLYDWPAHMELRMHNPLQPDSPQHAKPLHCFFGSHYSPPIFHEEDGKIWYAKLGAESVPDKIGLNWWQQRHMDFHDEVTYREWAVKSVWIAYLPSQTVYQGYEYNDLVNYAPTYQPLTVQFNAAALLVSQGWNGPNIALLPWAIQWPFPPWWSYQYWKPYATDVGRWYDDNGYWRVDYSKPDTWTPPWYQALVLLDNPWHDNILSSWFGIKPWTKPGEVPIGVPDPWWLFKTQEEELKPAIEIDPENLPGGLQKGQELHIWDSDGVGAGIRIIVTNVDAWGKPTAWYIDRYIRFTDMAGAFYRLGDADIRTRYGWGSCRIVGASEGLLSHWSSTADGAQGWYGLSQYSGAIHSLCVCYHIEGTVARRRHEEEETMFVVRGQPRVWRFTLWSTVDPCARVPGVGLNELEVRLRVMDDNGNWDNLETTNSPFEIGAGMYGIQLTADEMDYPVVVPYVSAHPYATYWEGSYYETFTELPCGGGAGSGSECPFATLPYRTDITALDDEDQPIAGVHCWITATPDPDDPIAGASLRVTDDQGKLQLWCSIEEGEKAYLWAQHQGFGFDVPCEITIGTPYTLRGVPQQMAGPVTLSMLITRLRERLHDTAKGIWTDEELADALRDANVDMVLRSLCAWGADEITLETGKSTYELVDVFYPVHARIAGRALRIISGQEWADTATREALALDEQGEPTHAVWRNGSDLQLWPTPSETFNGKKLVVEGHVVDRTPMPTTSDAPSYIPPGFEYYLLDKAEATARTMRPTTSLATELATAAAQRYESAVQTLFMLSLVEGR